MAPTSPLPTLYCTADDAAAWLSQEGVDLRLDDDGDGVVADAEKDRLGVTAVNFAASEVNRFCLGRYDAPRLAASWSVNTWASALAARWLCLRRGNPVPKSLAEFVRDEVYPALRAVKENRESIEQDDVPARTTDGPAWSGVRVDSRHPLRKIRVERPLSEGTPPQAGRQNVDRAADLVQDTDTL